MSPSEDWGALGILEPFKVVTNFLSIVLGNGRTAREEGGRPSLAWLWGMTDGRGVASQVHTLIYCPADCPDCQEMSK